MKIPTTDAARKLGIHPASFVLYVSEMVGDLSDCWPEVDEGFIETIRTLRFADAADATPPATDAVQPASEPHEVGIAKRRSQAELRLLDKMERHDKWGGSSVSRRTLHNNYCQNVHDLDDAIDALVGEGLLIRGNQRDTFSLNPARKGDVQQAVAEARKR
jgi:hypothetical protein